MNWAESSKEIAENAFAFINISKFLFSCESQVIALRFNGGDLAW